jgi:hypothetical protein
MAVSPEVPKRSAVTRGRLLLVIIDFILPLPLTVLVFLLWRSACGALYAFYVLSLALAFGYLIPGIGTNLLGLWEFRWPFLRVGRFYAHHGFMYAPYMAAVFWVTCGVHYGAPRPGPAPIAAVAIIVANALVQGFVSCRHDVLGVRTGMIEVANDASDRGLSAEEIVNSWGPVGFSLIGGAYAAACLFARELIVSRGQRGPATLALLWCGGLALMAVVLVPYVIKERKRIRLPWRRSKR